jgi:hypothetical protein
MAALRQSPEKEASSSQTPEGTELIPKPMWAMAASHQLQWVHSPLIYTFFT